MLDGCYIIIYILFNGNKACIPQRAVCLRGGIKSKLEKQLYVFSFFSFCYSSTPKDDSNT